MDTEETEYHVVVMDPKHYKKYVDWMISNGSEYEFYENKDGSTVKVWMTSKEYEEYLEWKKMLH